MRSFDSEPVEIRLDACYCPNTPHETDIVYLASQLPMAGGMAAQSVIADAFDDQLKLQEGLAKIWIRHGVVGWNLVDEAGETLPLTPDVITASLPYGKGGRLIADKADDLYAEDILAPLVARLKNTSRSGQTNGSTSSRRPSTPRRRRSSSTATTAAAPPPG